MKFNDIVQMKKIVKVLNSLTNEEKQEVLILKNEWDMEPENKIKEQNYKTFMENLIKSKLT